MNYALAIKNLEKEILFEKQIHKRKIEEMNSHLEFLRKENTACLKCDGEGKVLRTVEGNGNNLEEVVCNVCGGTGSKNEQEE